MSFTHSVKVPTQYKNAAKILRKAVQDGASLKSLIYEETHARTGSLVAVFSKYSNHKNEIDEIINQSEILVKEPRLDPHMCRILITELLFGAKKLNGESKPVQCVRSYESKFNEILLELEKNGKGHIAEQKTVIKPRYIRINVNIISREDALTAFRQDGWMEVEYPDKITYDEFIQSVKDLKDEQFIKDLHVKNLYIFPPSSKGYWAKHYMVRECQLLLQDKASCLPAIILNPPKKSVVLDMCAAPGMKTTHLSAIMKNRGTVYAVEQNSERYKTLGEFVQSSNSKNVKPIHGDSLQLTEDQVPAVSYILVDPSCSGSGMTNRLTVIGNDSEKDEARIRKLALLQTKMLCSALQNFPNAKRVVYSTCSLHREENELVVQKCLDRCNNEWELVRPLTKEKWNNYGSKNVKHVGKKCLYAKPDSDLTDGFFVAVFERKFQEDENEEGMDHVDTADETLEIPVKKTKKRKVQEID